MVPAIDRTLEHLGLLYARFQFRKDADLPQPFTKFFSSARSILVVLPTGYEESIIAGDALQQFKTRLQHANLTVVNTGTRMTSLVGFPKCQVIRLDPPDITRFSLPSGPALQRIIHREHDVAMNLNLDFVLHAAYICKASRARVRVGFTHRASDVFYNVQLHLTSPRTPAMLYEKFAACLAMF